jgi:hypothetical protein
MGLAGGLMGLVNTANALRFHQLREQITTSEVGKRQMSGELARTVGDVARTHMGNAEYKQLQEQFHGVYHMPLAADHPLRAPGVQWREGESADAFPHRMNPESGKMEPYFPGQTIVNMGGGRVASSKGEAFVGAREGSNKKNTVGDDDDNNGGGGGGGGKPKKTKTTPTPPPGSKGGKVPFRARGRY